jgi:hypothetical protein
VRREGDGADSPTRAPKGREAARPIPNSEYLLAISRQIAKQDFHFSFFTLHSSFFFATLAAEI